VATSSTRIELFGEYDLERRAEVKELFSPLDGAAPIVIDLHDVSYADSSFLSELGMLRKRLPQCAIRLLEPSPLLQRILKLLAFDEIFEIVQND
jgi:anti-anti-sigma factor